MRAHLPLLAALLLPSTALAQPAAHGPFDTNAAAAASPGAQGIGSGTVTSQQIQAAGAMLGSDNLSEITNPATALGKLGGLPIASTVASTNTMTLSAQSSAAVVRLTDTFGGETDQSGNTAPGPGNAQYNYDIRATKQGYGKGSVANGIYTPTSPIGEIDPINITALNDGKGDTSDILMSTQRYDYGNGTSGGFTNNIEAVVSWFNPVTGKIDKHMDWQAGSITATGEMDGLSILPTTGAMLHGILEYSDCDAGQTCSIAAPLEFADSSANPYFEVYGDGSGSPGAVVARGYGSFGGQLVTGASGSQTQFFTYHALTSSTAATRLTMDGNAPGTGNQACVSPSGAAQIDFRFVGYDRTTPGMPAIVEGWQGHIIRTGAASTTTVTYDNGSTNTGTAPSVTADTTNGCVAVSITPTSTDTISWTASVRLTLAQ